ncbi:MAG: acyl-CoA dehydrogenase family protein, partial [Betaproteobacteria bacterium]
MMSEILLSRRNLDFLLYEVLKVEDLSRFERHQGQDRATYEAILDLYEKLATDYFLPHAAEADAKEPSFDGETVTVHPAAAPALQALAESGLLAATQSEQDGGFAVPHAIERAGIAYLTAANPGTAGYAFLTIANMNLLRVHASDDQVRRYVSPMLEGRFFGTMCLSEPQAGSSLADIRTRAIRQSDGRYRLFGNKMWISGGDHSISENIIHAVLAKIPDETGAIPAGTRG